jgi:light-regulated signal transduction histidine kinase (bacteriophytochrome)
MSSSIDDKNSRRVLVHAPFGRDAALISGVLRQAGIETEVCLTVEQVCAQIVEGVGALLVADETLSPPNIKRIQTVLKAEPPWSNLPVLVMTRRSDDIRHSRRRLVDAFGNVNLLERPLWTETIATNCRMALRAREHQYQIRDYVGYLQTSADALARSNAELQRANDDLNQFVFSASHDLREPLRTIATYCQLIERRYASAFDEQGSKFLRFALGGAERMERLLNDLLTYIQVGREIEKVATPVSTSGCVHKVLANIDGQLETSSVDVGTLPVVPIAEVHLIQLFQNLISNALKYCEAQPRIWIGAEPKDGMWRFYVRDNGIGIEPQYAEQVFGLFKRLHGSSEKYAGTGIGLSICQRIVERYGGHIWVESEGLGKGSTFYFTLPKTNGPR